MNGDSQLPLLRSIPQGLRASGPREPIHHMKMERDRHHQRVPYRTVPYRNGWETIHGMSSPIRRSFFAWSKGEQIERLANPSPALALALARTVL